MKNFGKTFLFLLVVFILQHCSPKQPKQNQPDQVVDATGMETLGQVAAWDTIPVDEPDHVFEKSQEEPADTIPKETRLRYPAFGLVFHDFKGYEAGTEEYGYRTYIGQFGGGSDYNEAKLNDDELENEDYVETLVVKKDTLHISEFLFDDRINNTLIEVIPNNKNDRFKMSFCYLSTLHEIIDGRGLTEKELEARLKKAKPIDEQTRFYSIKDSANFFFRAMPHTPDMIAVTLKADKVVQVKENTPAHLNWEQKQAEEEVLRIKKKYQLRDTLVVIPGEYDTEATLTKNKKLFSYGYDAFLFRLERFTNNKLIETKYIVVSIGYGC